MLVFDFKISLLYRNRDERCEKRTEKRKKNPSSYYSYYNPFVLKR